MFRTEELVYPGIPMEEVDRFLKPDYEIRVVDDQPQAVEDGRPNLTLTYEDEFIPNADIKPEVLDKRRTSVAGAISRVIMPEAVVEGELEPEVVRYRANILIEKPGFLGRLIARVKNEQPTAKAYASIILGERGSDGTLK